MATKKRSNKYIGSSLDEWLEEEAAKDPSFAAGVNEQLDKIGRPAKKGQPDAPVARRARRPHR